MRRQFAVESHDIMTVDTPNPLLLIRIGALLKPGASGIRDVSINRIKTEIAISRIYGDVIIFKLRNALLVEFEGGLIRQFFLHQNALDVRIG